MINSNGAIKNLKTFQLKFRRIESIIIPQLALLCFFCGLLAVNGATEKWLPPVGVPHPEFGIAEQHTMYRGKLYDSGAGFVPYKDAGSGPYTHYVDNTNPNATDSDNPFGSFETPRKTWPLDLTPGSVVEVHGGPYTVKNFTDKAGINSLGTKEKPVFFRGANNKDLPILAKDLYVSGTYMVVENLHFANRRINLRQDLLRSDIANIAIRNLKMEGVRENLGMTAAISVGLWGVPNANAIRNIVIKECEITDYGDRYTLRENDACGVVVSGFDTYNTWIIDNKIGRLSGDSVRVGKNAGGSYVGNASKVYIGRNTFFDNKEDAIDVKEIKDVVISGNDMVGTVVVHYDCENVWLVNNTFHDSKNAIISTGVVGLYILNNIFRDIEVKAIQFWGSGEIHIVNNTITRVGHGIWNAGGGDKPKPIYNNVISMLNGNNGTNYHIYYNNTSLAKTSLLQNNLFWQGENNPIQINWGGKVYRDAVSLSNAGFDNVNGSIQEDPKFLDPGNNDFRLSSKSAGIDRGITAPYNSLYQRLFGIELSSDIAQQPRIRDGDRDGRSQIDIGAFEFDPQAPPRPPRNLRIADQVNP